VDAPSNKGHAEPLGVPMPTPIAIVAGGDAAVRTTVTVPVADVVNPCTALPRTATVPVKVSVDVVAVGAVVVVVVVVDDVVLLELSLLHAAASSASPSVSAFNPDRRITSGVP